MSMSCRLLLSMVLCGLVAPTTLAQDAILPSQALLEDAASNIADRRLSLKAEIGRPIGASSLVSVNSVPSSNLPPVADFTGNEAGYFDAHSSYDPDGSIVGYTWDFGDGDWEMTTDPSAYHHYNVEVGTVFWVTLIVYDNEGAGDFVYKQIYVTPY